MVWLALRSSCSLRIYIQGEDILQSDPNTTHVSAGLAAMECVVVHDLFLSETANYAHVFLPGSTFLEMDGTFTNAERRIQRVRRAMSPPNGYADWEITQQDRLEMHPHDAEQRGVKDGDWVRIASRAGETALRVLMADRVAPTVVYTTFHHPPTQANVITTDYSDWATNCPEYKVTAVQVSPSNGPTNYQEDYEAFARQSRRIVPAEAAE